VQIAIRSSTSTIDCSRHRWAWAPQERIAALCSWTHLRALASTNNGNVSSQAIRALNTSGVTLTITQNFTYDSLNRLSTAIEAGTGTWGQTYDYDRYGNRAVRIGSSIPNPALTPTSTMTGDMTALFDLSTNRLKPTTNFLYDESGNLKSDPTTATNAYLYDSENKQTSYTKAGLPTSCRKTSFLSAKKRKNFANGHFPQGLFPMLSCRRFTAGENSFFKGEKTRNNFAFW
jgi:hypothetical protein